MLSEILNIASQSIAPLFLLLVVNSLFALMLVLVQGASFSLYKGYNPAAFDKAAAISIVVVITVSVIGAVSVAMGFKAAILIAGAVSTVTPLALMRKSTMLKTA